MRAYPHHQTFLAFWAFTVDWLSTRKKLKEYNTKGIDINFITHFAMHEVFWSQVTAIGSVSEYLSKGNAETKEDITHPNVPATSVQLICDDVDAQLASPKSES